MDIVNWESLFAKYDTDRNGEMDSKELTFLIRDLLNLRDNVCSHSFEETIPIAKKVTTNKNWKIISPVINTAQLREAAICGAFEELSLSPDLFILLSSVSDETAKILAQAAEDQKLRQQVSSALRQGEEKFAALLLRSNSVELEEDDGNLMQSLSGQTFLCKICFDAVNEAEIYGGNPSIEKKCNCDVQVCFPCLRSCARDQIRLGVRPTCPGRASLSQRCTQPLDNMLLALLFKKQCPICEDRLDGGKPCSVVPCALEHSFCTPCLRSKALEDLQSKRYLPRCPRAAECHFVYDEPAFRSTVKVVGGSTASNAAPTTGDCEGAVQHPINSTEGDVEDFVVAWHDLRVQLAQDAHPLAKGCPTPDCQGYLTASREVDRTKLPTEVLCGVCHRPYCWQCLKKCHPRHSCIEAENITSRWIGFLRSVAGQSSLSSGSSDVGSASVDSAVVEAAANALLKLEHERADKAYFARNISSGNMKRCPSCRRLIEKQAGCDSMVCGRNADGGNQQDGCGHSFSWSSVPILDESAVEVQLQTGTNARRGKLVSDGEFDLSNSEFHIDLSTLSAWRPPSVMRCMQCLVAITGPRFECINCSDPHNLCLACVRQHFDPSKGTQHANHVFSCTSPPKPTPAAKVLRAEVFPNGAIGIYGLDRAFGFREQPSQVVDEVEAAGDRDEVGMPNFAGAQDLDEEEEADEDESSPSPHHLLGQGDQRRHFNTHCVVVLVEVYPNGQIVFADNHGRAASWLSLDSISFKLDGKGRRVDVQVDARFAAEVELRPPAVVKSHVLAKAYGHIVLRPALSGLRAYAEGDDVEAGDIGSDKATDKDVLDVGGAGGGKRPFPEVPHSISSQSSSETQSRHKRARLSGGSIATEADSLFITSDSPRAFGRGGTGAGVCVGIIGEEAVPYTRSVLPVAVMPNTLSISLNQIVYETIPSGGRDEGGETSIPQIPIELEFGVSPLGGDYGSTATFCIDSDVVHLHGFLLLDWENCLSDVLAAHTAQVAAMGDQQGLVLHIATLPEGALPAMVSDFLVVGDDGHSGGVIGLAVVRIQVDGRVMFLGTPADAPLRKLTRLSLDSIRFIEKGAARNRRLMVFANGASSSNSAGAFQLGPNVTPAAPVSVAQRSAWAYMTGQVVKSRNQVTVDVGQQPPSQASARPHTGQGMFGLPPPVFAPPPSAFGSASFGGGSMMGRSPFDHRSHTSQGGIFSRHRFAMTCPSGHALVVVSGGAVAEATEAMVNPDESLCDQCHVAMPREGASWWNCAECNVDICLTCGPSVTVGPASQGLPRDADADVWAPGDIIGHLPPSMRPAAKCSFVTIAGAAPAWPVNRGLGGPGGPDVPVFFGGAPAFRF